MIGEGDGVELAGAVSLATFLGQVAEHSAGVTEVPAALAVLEVGRPEFLHDREDRVQLCHVHRHPIGLWRAAEHRRPPAS